MIPDSAGAPTLDLRYCLKASVENPRGSGEKLSSKKSIKGADTVPRGSVRAPKGFAEGKPEAAKPRGRSPQGFAAKGLPQLFNSAPRIFKGCSDY